MALVIDSAISHKVLDKFLTIYSFAPTPHYGNKILKKKILFLHCQRHYLVIIALICDVNLRVMTKVESLIDCITK